MALRRGFKSEAEKISKDLRDRLGKSDSDPLSPQELAQLLGIEIRAGDELIPLDRFRELEELQPGAFSACTLKPSTERVVIVHNPLYSESRRNSDLTHEIAHILLGHELSRIEKMGDLTFRSCNPTQEQEAGWLSGSLLLPRTLLLKEVGNGEEAPGIAKKYRVSEDMARYRIRVTGVERQLARRR